MKAAENTTTPIMSEIAMKEKINNIVEELIILKGEIAMKEKLFDIMDNLTSLKGDFDELYTQDSAAWWLDHAIRELSGDDCLSRLASVSNKDIAIAYAIIGEYIRETEDTVSDDDADLQTARNLRSRIGDIWDELDNIDQSNQLLERLSDLPRQMNFTSWAIHDNDMSSQILCANDSIFNALLDLKVGNFDGVRVNTEWAVKRLKDVASRLDGREIRPIRKRINYWLQTIEGIQNALEIQPSKSQKS